MKVKAIDPASVPAWKPETRAGSVLMPTATVKAGRCPGVGALEFGGQGQQRGLGLQRRSGMVGVGHLPADSGPKALRQMIFHVPNLV